MPVPRQTTPAPAVSVIVPALNAAATIEATLRALDAQDFGEPFEVIVADDGSRDETAAIAAGWGGRVRLVCSAGGGPAGARNGGGAGPAGARNAAAREARGLVLAFTDADCHPAAGWLSAGVRALGDADLVQGAVSPQPEARRHPLVRTVWVVAEVGLYETANLFVTRDLFDRIGGFEDWLGPVLGKPLAEDVWFGWRARRLGARTAFAADAVVHHAVFRLGFREYVWERRRLAYFPAIAAKVPELRRSLFFGRLFLSRRTAAYDLALTGGAAAALISSPLPLLATAPYAAILLPAALRWRRHAPLATLATLAADTVGAAALAWGSVRWRSPVL